MNVRFGFAVVALFFAIVGLDLPVVEGSGGQPTAIYVDADGGSDRASGVRGSPLRTISAALALLVEPLQEEVTIHLSAGHHGTTGGVKMPPGTLQLDVRMKGAARVRILGEDPKPSGRAGPGTVVLDWESSARLYLIEVGEGRWSIENIQLGTRRKRQRQGISVAGPAVLELTDVRIRTRSFSGAGLRAHRGGQILLRGTIELNEDLHEEIPEKESFSGIVAEDHGIVRFTAREGSSLSMGNGSLAASYYGCIRLGCEEARITSWGGQSNNIAVNNSGRVDLHGTRTTLIPKSATNSPIGLEDDGHVLAEGAHILIHAVEDGSGVVLQKSSALYCNDIEFEGKPKYTLLAYSGSNFVGGFRGNIRAVHATTGAAVVIGQCTGKLIGPFQATKGGSLFLPDGRSLPEGR